MSFTVKGALLPEAVARFVTQEIVAESALEARLRAETRKLPNHGMISGSDVGALLGLLVQISGARRALEIGTFTGYTALKIALALPADGSLVCCDINAAWTDIGRAYWREAGIEQKIDLRLAPAETTLDNLLNAGARETFDFAFIDANKKRYDLYYERCLALLRPGGVVVLDNMLWDGAVANPDDTDSMTRALRALNFKIAGDARVAATLLTVGDGLMVARRLNTV